jgi:hypothetical protein
MKERTSTPLLRMTIPTPDFSGSRLTKALPACGLRRDAEGYVME